MLLITKNDLQSFLEPVLEIKDFLITNKSNDAAGHSNPDEKYHLDEELRDIFPMNGTMKSM